MAPLRTSATSFVETFSTLPAEGVAHTVGEGHPRVLVQLQQVARVEVGVSLAEDVAHDLLVRSALVDIAVEGQQWVDVAQQDALLSHIDAVAKVLLVAQDVARSLVTAHQNLAGLEPPSMPGRPSKLMIGALPSVAA